jgi:hypothetical protein
MHCVEYISEYISDDKCRYVQQYFIVFSTDEDVHV